MESRELAIRLARALDAKKAFNIHILEVEDLTPLPSISSSPPVTPPPM